VRSDGTLIFVVPERMMLCGASCSSSIWKDAVAF
jgi:hypothetical protein